MPGELRIGTSGWNYKHWLERFYPKGLAQTDLLSFYADHFDTVEINNSFYQLPTIKAVNHWRQTVPEGFVFAVKASRFTTHMKKLKAPKSSTRKMFARIRRLEKTLGPILFQLPTGWRCNEDRLAQFLDALPSEHQYAFEFRDPTWLRKEVYDLLSRHKAAFCIHDFRGEETPRIISADFTYIRFHGPTAAAYSGSYGISALRKWARQIEAWRKELKTVYAYFNNDVEGHAIKNALQLRELCNS
jgi:uncharacterized protein YecE (DUF72 family)